MENKDQTRIENFVKNLEANIRYFAKKENGELDKFLDKIYSKIKEFQCLKINIIEDKSLCI